VSRFDLLQPHIIPALGALLGRGQEGKEEEEGVEMCWYM